MHVEQAPGFPYFGVMDKGGAVVSRGGFVEAIHVFVFVTYFGRAVNKSLHLARYFESSLHMQWLKYRSRVCFVSFRFVFFCFFTKTDKILVQYVLFLFKMSTDIVSNNLPLFCFVFCLLFDSAVGAFLCVLSVYSIYSHDALMQRRQASREEGLGRLKQRLRRLESKR